MNWDMTKWVFVLLFAMTTTAPLCEPDWQNDGILDELYIDFVPHTDKNGLILKAYDQEKSFFPIGIWGVPLPGTYHGTRYDWSALKAAGFNVVWPWYQDILKSLQFAKLESLQVIAMGELSKQTLVKVKSHPNLMGNMYKDEPMSEFSTSDMFAMFMEYESYRKEIKEIAPSLPVFINDAPNFTGLSQGWWKKWANSGDISCHDNYVIFPGTFNLINGVRGAPETGIHDSLLLARKAITADKPLWIILGAFEQNESPLSNFPFRYPSPQQLRAMVYSSIIHGATGITYFTLDSYISRGSSVLGFSPKPRTYYAKAEKNPMSKLQAVQSVALWETIKQTNLELQRLAKLVLTPSMKGFLKKIVVQQTLGVPRLRALVKQDADNAYIMAVNLDGKPYKAEFHLFDHSTQKVVDYFGEGHDPTTTKFGFTDDFEPYGVKVYRIAK